MLVYLCSWWGVSSSESHHIRIWVSFIFEFCFPNLFCLLLWLVLLSWGGWLLCCCIRNFILQQTEFILSFGCTFYFFCFLLVSCEFPVFFCPWRKDSATIAFSFCQLVLTLAPIPISILFMFSLFVQILFLFSYWTL